MSAVPFDVNAPLALPAPSVPVPEFKSSVEDSDDEDEKLMHEEWLKKNGPVDYRTYAPRKAYTNVPAAAPVDKQ
jgi:hypothetical protein